MPKMRKYFAYLDDGHNTYKIAVPAVNEDQVRDFCAGNGDVIAIKDVTDSYPISEYAVARVLLDATARDGERVFAQHEVDFICRALREIGLVDD